MIYRLVAIFITLLITFTSACATQGNGSDSGTLKKTDPRAEDELIENAEIKKKLRLAVQDLIYRERDSNGTFIVNIIGTQERQLVKLVKIFDDIRRRDSVYTVRVAVDELIVPIAYRLLFFDFESENNHVKFLGLRDGGRMKETSELLK